MAMLSQEELQKVGFASVGRNVLVSAQASIYNPGRIRLGDNVRIDDFCVLAAGEGGISIGNHVHVAVMCTLIGAGAITISDFCGLSSRVSIYSSTDDYSGAAMTNPTVPAEFTNVTSAPVTLGRYVALACGCILMPGVTVGEGAAVGALSLVTADLQPFSIYAGTPARRVAERRRDMVELSERLMAREAAQNAPGRK